MRAGRRAWACPKGEAEAAECMAGGIRSIGGAMRGIIRGDSISSTDIIILLDTGKFVAGEKDRVRKSYFETKLAGWWIVHNIMEGGLLSLRDVGWWIMNFKGIQCLTLKE
jgi:hypothetical protein